TATSPATGSESGSASEPSTGEEEGGTSPMDTGAPGVMHAACTTPFPDVPPALPSINTADDGRPAFALWQDLACDAPGVPGSTCTEGGCAVQVCTQLGGDYGVCTTGDIDIWCDGEGEVVGTVDGSCWICMYPELHARACCEEPAGHFDCRHWPFTEERSTIGQVCATHGDCEDGLACSANAGEGYGICACPETPSNEIIPGNECF
ncbi:MAG TPA: hypothetical protein VG755_26250, partial [Nannocystaceae bacterium]|nr:hypothetical protein [Nannocystaceae bacterium]